MTSDIRLAGFTLTADEWDRFDPDTRAELLDGPGDLADLDDDGALDDGAADVLW